MIGVLSIARKQEANIMIKEGFLKILNPNNLPEALVKAVMPEDGHVLQNDRLSVTALVGSP